MARITSWTTPCVFALLGAAVGAGCGDDTGGEVTATEGASSSGTTAEGDTIVTPPADTTSPPNDDTATTDVDTTTGETSGTSCGDGVLDEGEDCDDGNSDDSDGCSAACAVEDGWECDDAEPSACATVCGDGVVAGDETCDDSNKIDTDDCTNACLEAACGDSIVWEGNETCDDGNADALDGCSETCQVEAGSICEDGTDCFPVAFFADGSQGVPGNLYAISLDGTTTVTVGPLSVGVTGLAYHPDGTLYAVSSTGFETSELGTIDPVTATFTAIGDLVSADGDSHGAMPDITFMGEQLLGWSEFNDTLVTIDIATGEVAELATAQDSSGTALAYDPATDNLFLSPNGSAGTLFSIDTVGTVTAGATLAGVHESVRGMAFTGGVLYGMDTITGLGNGAVGDFVTYDTMTGTVTIIAALPAEGLDAMAVYDPDNVAAR